MTVQSVLDKIAGKTPTHTPVVYSTAERNAAKKILEGLLIRAPKNPIASIAPVVKELEEVRYLLVSRTYHLFCYASVVSRILAPQPS